MFDLVIGGGTVIDGTGGDPLDADVAVQDGRIALVGRVRQTGREEVDASDHLVRTPHSGPVAGALPGRLVRGASVGVGHA